MKKQEADMKYIGDLFQIKWLEKTSLSGWFINWSLKADRDIFQWGVKNTTILGRRIVVQCLEVRIRLEYLLKWKQDLNGWFGASSTLGKAQLGDQVT